MGFFPVGRSYRSSAMRATTNRISSETLVVGRVVEFIFFEWCGICRWDQLFLVPLSIGSF